MNYEEKYKSALEWIRSIYPTMQGAEKEDAEHYFPELKESEDERIRKEIINYFKCQSRDEPSRKDIHDKWIAWIEKQGEQKPVEERQYIRKIIDTTTNKVIGYQTNDGLFTSETNSAWSEEDEKIRRGLIDRFKSLKPNFSWYEIPIDDIISWLKSLKSNHWRPTENQMSMLLAVIHDGNNANSESCHNVLQSLYNNLKKL